MQRSWVTHTLIMEIDDPTALLGNSSRFRVTQELCIKSWCGLILQKREWTVEEGTGRARKEVMGIQEKCFRNEWVINCQCCKVKDEFSKQCFRFHWWPWNVGFVVAFYLEYTHTKVFFRLVHSSNPLMLRNGSPRNQKLKSAPWMARTQDLACYLLLPGCTWIGVWRQEQSWDSSQITLRWDMDPKQCFIPPEDFFIYLFEKSNTHTGRAERENLI